jgi:hypothetical protein
MTMSWSGANYFLAAPVRLVCNDTGELSMDGELHFMLRIKRPTRGDHLRFVLRDKNSISNQHGRKDASSKNLMSSASYNADPDSVRTHSLLASYWKLGWFPSSR